MPGRELERVILLDLALFQYELVSQIRPARKTSCRVLRGPRKGGISVPRDLSWLPPRRLLGDKGIRYDIASAGSGFQQVLMLLTFLHTRPGPCLIGRTGCAPARDSPGCDLRRAASSGPRRRSRSSSSPTHSEVIIKLGRTQRAVRDVCTGHDRSPTRRNARC